MTLLHVYYMDLKKHYRERLEIFPYAKEALVLARERGFKLALVSSAEKELVESCLEAFSLTQLFDAIVPNQEGLMSKPAPDLYLKGLNLLEVPAESALAIEDAENGVAASVAANIFTLWITHHHEKRFSEKFGVMSAPVRDWTEVIQCFQFPPISSLRPFHTLGKKYYQTMKNRLLKKSGREKGVSA
jgi:HAD superfamily hydrolase (TIGR01509 family)